QKQNYVAQIQALANKAASLKDPVQFEDVIQWNAPANSYQPFQDYVESADISRYVAVRSGRQYYFPQLAAYKFDQVTLERDSTADSRLQVLYYGVDLRTPDPRHAGQVYSSGVTYSFAEYFSDSKPPGWQTQTWAISPPAGAPTKVINGQTWIFY